MQTAREANPDAANKMYQPIMVIDLSGVKFNVYGSMSWTVNKLKERPWEELRKAYVGLSGDTRENVGRDAAANVVAGELQITWAKLSGREDLIPKVEMNQQTRLEMALKSTAHGEPKRIMRSPRPQQDNTKPREGTMAEGETQETENATEGGTATEAASKGDKKVRTSIPTRGSMGKAAEIINAGERDEAKIVKGVEEAFPAIKNAGRHIRYVAKLMGVTLTREGKAVPESTDTAAPATETVSNDGTQTQIEPAATEPVQA